MDFAPLSNRYIVKSYRLEPYDINGIKKPPINNKRRLGWKLLARGERAKKG
jgi:hypothetical protein